MEKIKFYGTRGTCSLTDKKYLEFGGATTCILLNLDKTHLMIDCGSGINNAINDLKNIDELHLFISHSHLDHISGIMTLLSSFEDKPLHIYGKTYDGISIKNVIQSVMSKALWPVSLDSYKNVFFHEIKEDFFVNKISVKTMDSNHPGNCCLFRFENSDEIIVTAFDFCHLNAYDKKLIKFAQGCTSLIYDGCMSAEDLKNKPDWGHSTPEAGVEIAKQLNVNELIITHFGLYDDEQLAKWEKTLQKSFKNVRFARSGCSSSELKKMIEIGTMMAGEKDNDLLLTKIVDSCMDITAADGGTLYLLEKDKLEFKVLINKSKNTRLIRKEESLGIPSVSINGKNACAQAARLKKLINIIDCYEDKEFDFSGAKQYDKLNSYLTKSVIVIPLIDEYNDVIGVLQLINATDENGKVVPFKKQDEEVLMAIANQASVSIVNADYSNKINELLYGFVKVMSVGIDERTPYNVNHTRNMVRFAEKFFDFEDKTNGEYKVDAKQRREILMSIWLHDIGKILTPIEIMNKNDRLGNLYSGLINRFERRNLLLRLQLANKEITENEYKTLEQERLTQLEEINSINKAGFLTDELKGKVEELSKKTYKELNGEIVPILTKEEQYQLLIVKGTLNKEERSIMEGHVSMTQKFLSQLNFPKHYDNIPTYAGNHHEFLNGSGYPNHLKDTDLPWPCRLITICDIFEALIAKDRPYKKPMTVEKALSILNEMVNFGQLDGKIVKEFELSKSWEE